MGMRAATAVLGAAIALAADGCGSRQPHPAAVSGRVVFTEHCSVCHSLSGIDNPRLQGGDLLGFHARRSEVVQFVREMPVVHRPLTHGELQAVVAYVMAAERRASRP